MSRYSGPQQRGAGKQARVEKRRQAEERQAAERERDARRRAEQSRWEDERPLTDDEVDGLIRAVAAVRLGEVVDRLGWQPRQAAKTKGPGGTR